MPSGAVEYAQFQNYNKEPGAIPEIVFACIRHVCHHQPSHDFRAIADAQICAYCLFVLLWTTLCTDRCPLGLDDEGWLFKKGALDFDGGTVVHLSFRIPLCHVDVPG
jgi:Amt family ammonium transporter